MKRDKNYKMPKRIKTLLALLPFKNKEERNNFKNSMIDAEIVDPVQSTRKKVFT
jgi:hypothetical protein